MTRWRRFVGCLSEPASHQEQAAASAWRRGLREWTMEAEPGARTRVGCRAWARAAAARGWQRAERSATDTTGPGKKKTRKRKKERKTVRVNRATRKVFWKKYSFRAKRGKEDFFQKPEGLDLAVGAA